MKSSGLVLCLMMLIVSGCATTGMGRASYNQRISDVTLDMSKKDFLNVFPNAEPRGAKKYPNGIIEVLEVYTQSYHFIPTGAERRNPLTGMEGAPQWFYFYNDKLIQYGKPEDFPADPDSIIEIRHR